MQRVRQNDSKIIENDENCDKVLSLNVSFAFGIREWTARDKK